MNQHKLNNIMHIYTYHEQKTPKYAASFLTTHCAFLLGFQTNFNERELQLFNGITPSQ
jgi:hypothetical protein